LQKAVKFKVTGRVQGVGFRYFTRQHARALGIDGFVKNHYDGSVMGLAQGEKTAVDQFINLLKQGPSFSHVSDVKVTSCEARDNYSDFQIKM